MESNGAPPRRAGGSPNRLGMDLRPCWIRSERSERGRFGEPVVPPGRKGYRAVRRRPVVRGEGIPIGSGLVCCPSWPSPSDSRFGALPPASATRAAARYVAPDWPASSWLGSGDLKDVRAASLLGVGGIRVFEGPVRALGASVSDQRDSQRDGNECANDRNTDDVADPADVSAFDVGRLDGSIEGQRACIDGERDERGGVKWRGPQEQTGGPNRPPGSTSLLHFRPSD